MSRERTDFYEIQKKYFCDSHSVSALVQHGCTYDCSFNINDVKYITVNKNGVIVPCDENTIGYDFAIFGIDSHKRLIEDIKSLRAIFKHKKIILKHYHKELNAYYSPYYVIRELKNNNNYILDLISNNVATFDELNSILYKEAPINNNIIRHLTKELRGKISLLQKEKNYFSFLINIKIPKALSCTK